MLGGYVRHWHRDQSPNRDGEESRNTDRVPMRARMVPPPRRFDGTRSRINTLSFLLALPRHVSSAIGLRLAALASDQGGNIAVVTALALPILIGATGLGLETSYWYLTQRSMQNAADSAAVAAATIGAPNYEFEARAVAARYGFEHGKGNLSVSASKAVACPAGGNDCYSVTITGYVPLLLSQIVGYNGNACVSSTQNGKTVTTRQTQLGATAVAPGHDATPVLCVGLGCERRQVRHLGERWIEVEPQQLRDHVE
jgi:Flp pilus assembly protein TadG